MTELLAGVVVSLVALVLVLEPLVTGVPRGMTAAIASNDDGDIDLSDIEESESPKIRALLALKEIEFDRETGKLSDEDYSALKAAYQRVALAALDQESKETAAEIEDTITVCPSCGPRPEATARFCSSCGRELKAVGASARCRSCGAAVPDGAKFCGDCGAAL
jgi:hypothetical protein